MYTRYNNHTSYGTKSTEFVKLITGFRCTWVAQSGGCTLNIILYMLYGVMVYT